MGDKECPSPGHGGRTNPTRRRMKALKSTFTAPGAALKRTSAERRATGEAPSGLRIGRKEPCGPTTVAIGAIRWPLRTGSDAGSSPGGERELFSEIEARLVDGAPSGAPGARRTRSWPIRARNGDGGPGPDREPTANEGASPRERGSGRGREWHERTRSARAGVDRRAGRYRASGARSSRVPVSEPSRREAGSTRWVGEARASPPAALEPRGARRTPGPRGLRQP
jgi:hypothetical protein